MFAFVHTTLASSIYDKSAEIGVPLKMLCMEGILRILWLCPTIVSVERKRNDEPNEHQPVVGSSISTAILND